jgi:Ni,Fe-hydrogenase III large subunit
MEKGFAELVNNPAVVSLSEVPVLEYPRFMTAVSGLMESEAAHCLAYFAVPESHRFRFFCFMADDASGKILITSHEQPQSPGLVLESMTARHFPFHVFEREIHEEHGVMFSDHPWLKPVRYPLSEPGEKQQMGQYPFYRIESDELHEVGVGPIHAGVIEPGYFRFICNGETVLHLEIQLGYQHRGAEPLLVRYGHGLRSAVLSENIAGDTAIGHSLCHVQLVESLAGREVSGTLQTWRIIALEMERIAMHIGDTAALCADIGYQLGQAVNEALRTIVINTTQLWCGNRFGKGLIRSGGTHYPLTPQMSKTILANLKEVEERYLLMAAEMFSLPSVLARFESVGEVTAGQAAALGAVGMAARSSGLKRDIRWSHPFQGFRYRGYDPVILEEGDVWARAILRKKEVEESLRIIRALLSDNQGESITEHPQYGLILAPSSVALSMTEGWRGEIVHAAVTDEKGNIAYYKVKDPSMHNWMALAVAVRNQEISDFPLCNKSFNLSYCGNDL